MEGEPCCPCLHPCHPPRAEGQAYLVQAGIVLFKLSEGYDSYLGGLPRLARAAHRKTITTRAWPTGISAGGSALQQQINSIPTAASQPYLNTLCT